MKERFIKLWQSVERDGVKELLEWLETTDFYTAPCSTRYHLAREGGLLEHSLNVYECLFKRDEAYESTIITALSHDFCKIGFYAVEMKWRKDAKNQWEQYPAYVVKDTFPFG
ncbi:MAG: hydrolase, partial [Phycisphaerae bacterium]